MKIEHRKKISHYVVCVIIFGGAAYFIEVHVLISLVFTIIMRGVCMCVCVCVRVGDRVNRVRERGRE